MDLPQYNVELRTTSNTGYSYPHSLCVESVLYVELALMAAQEILYLIPYVELTAAQGILLQTTVMLVVKLHNKYII